MDLFETVLSYLAKCNRDDGDIHMLTVVATPTKTTYTILCERQTQQLIESNDLEEIAAFLKSYVSWVN